MLILGVKWRIPRLMYIAFKRKGSKYVSCLSDIVIECSSTEVNAMINHLIFKPTFDLIEGENKRSVAKTSNLKKAPLQFQVAPKTFGVEILS